MRNPPRLRSRPWLVVSILIGTASVLGLSVLVLLRVRPWEILAPTASVPPAPARPAFDGDFSTADSVSIVLGEAEVVRGLRHLAEQSDGLTAVESVQSASARVLRLPAKSVTVVRVQ